MNTVDLVIILLLIIMVGRGADIGLVRQSSSLIGLVVGLLAGSFIASLFNASATVSLSIILATVLLASVGSEYAGIQLKNAIHGMKIHSLDRLLGAALGSVICLAAVWFGSTLVSAISSPGLQQGVRDSHIIAWLDQRLPPPTDVMQWLESSLAQTNLPKLLNDLEPKLPDTDATLPDPSSFSAEVAAAHPSVVEIEGRSCSGLSIGSGFVADSNTIVTNAHVVAGMLRPYVEDANGRHTAEIIGFNPDLDIAVLRVHGLAGKSLPMNTQTVDPKTEGIALGYPAGGPFAARPAVVVERFTALGSNIYGEHPDDRRDVYAIKANIEPGNSGGPLLDRSGTVVGVVFARSTTYKQVGYALTTPAVVTALHGAEQHPSAGVSSRCSAD